MKFGATGTFPRGKLNAHDEGGLTMGVAHDDKGLVHVNFGKKIRWFALPSADAIDLAKLILTHAGAKKVEIEL